MPLQFGRGRKNPSIVEYSALPPSLSGDVLIAQTITTKRYINMEKKYKLTKNTKEGDAKIEAYNEEETKILSPVAEIGDTVEINGKRYKRID